MTSEARAKILPWVLGLLPFCFFWLTGLFDVDEGFYGAAIRGMLESGDWILPRYRGEPWLEKPILLYWLASPTVAVFGEVVGPRLPSVLASIGTIWLSYRFAQRRWGWESARMVPLMFGGSVLFVLPGSMLLADPSMTFFLSAGIILLIEAISGETRLAWFAGACLGLAMLAKGPVSLVVTLLVLAWSYIADPQYRERYMRFAFPILAGSIAVSCLWYVPAYLASPQAFVDEFVIKQNIMRLAGGDKAHGVWAWAYIIYYIVVLGVAFAPWSWIGAKRLKSLATIEDRWLVRWFAVIFVLFTLSGSKLPHYILPATVPLGLLAAKFIGERRGNPYPVIGAAMCLFCTLITAIAVPVYYSSSGQREAHELVRSVRGSEGRLWTYQLRPKERRIGPQLNLQESSLPSLEFYCPGTLEAFDESDLERVAPGDFVFTRKGRISTELAKRLGLDVQKRGYTDRYILYVRKPL